MTDRADELLGMLAESSRPLTGPELAERLKVSTRSVRNYVHSLNHEAGLELVSTTHQGYQLERPVYAAWQVRQRRHNLEKDSPSWRLYTIVRHLISNSSTGTDVFKLADLLCVSPSTIDADLRRARELFREYGLQVRRERSVLFLDGGEHNQRQLIRQVLLHGEVGVSPTMMQDFAEEFPDFDVQALSQRMQQLLSTIDMEVDAYALHDVVVHLTIAADRVRHGHRLLSAEAPTTANGSNRLTTERLVELVADEYGVVLPDSEAKALEAILGTRTNQHSTATIGPAVNPATLQIVREAMHDLSAAYLVEFYDEKGLVDLAFHVQSLIERIRLDLPLENLIGDSFKNMHPFIHELTLFFTAHIEQQAGVVIPPSEVEFLSFLLGVQLQRQLEQGPPVTITVVMPRFGTTHTDVVAWLTDACGSQAVIEDVISIIDYDWSRIASDLVVSSLDLAGLTSAPVVMISPLLRQEDRERVVDAVGAERRRARRKVIRSSILTMVEPGLFHKVSQMPSKEAALELMCRTMHEQGLTPSTYFADVMDRESRSSTSFGGQFAIPHSMKMDALRSVISVMVTDRAIPWGNASVRLVVLFAVSPGSSRLFRDVMDGLIHVLAEPENVSILLAASTDFSTFVETLAKLLEGTGNHA